MPSLYKRINYHFVITSFEADNYKLFNIFDYPRLLV